MTPLQLLASDVQRPHFPEYRSVSGRGLEEGYSLANWTLQNPHGVRTLAWIPKRRAARKVIGNRQQELEWRRANWPALSQHIGRWVVLERDQIKASASSLGEAVRQARASGIARPYVFLVDKPPHDFAILGL